VDPEIQARIDKLYADMKPLMDHFGIKPKTIDERYQDYLKKQAAIEEMKKLQSKRRPLPKWKL
jgi:hypothetical protein